MSNQRKRDYLGRVAECLAIAALSYIMIASFTALLDRHSFHSWKTAVRTLLNNHGEAKARTYGH